MVVTVFDLMRSLWVRLPVRYSYVDTESFVRCGPTVTTFFIDFLNDKGIDDRNTCTTKSGLSLSRQRKAI